MLFTDREHDMIGLALGALIPTLILLAIINAFTGEDVEFKEAFFAAAVSGVVVKFLTELAWGPFLNGEVTMGSLVAIIAVLVVIQVVIQFVVTAVAVQLICSTDLRHVLMIAGTYACVGLVWALVEIFVLSVFE